MLNRSCLGRKSISYLLSFYFYFYFLIFRNSCCYCEFKCQLHARAVLFAHLFSMVVLLLTLRSILDVRYPVSRRTFKSRAAFYAYLRVRLQFVITTTPHVPHARLGSILDVTISVISPRVQEPRVVSCFCARVAAARATAGIACSRRATAIRICNKQSYACCPRSYCFR